MFMKQLYKYDSFHSFDRQISNEMIISLFIDFHVLELSWAGAQTKNTDEMTRENL